MVVVVLELGNFMIHDKIDTLRKSQISSQHTYHLFHFFLLCVSKEKKALRCAAVAAFI